MNRIPNALVGMFIIMLSTTAYAENTYYIKLSDDDKGHRSVESPSYMSCDIGKVFNKDNRSWHCATHSECSSTTESSICGNKVRNMIIKSNGSIHEYGSSPGYHP